MRLDPGPYLASPSLRSRWMRLARNFLRRHCAIRWATHRHFCIRLSGITRSNGAISRMARTTIFWRGAP